MSSDPERLLVKALARTVIVTTIFDPVFVQILTLSQAVARL